MCSMYPCHYDGYAAFPDKTNAHFFMCKRCLGKVGAKPKLKNMFRQYNSKTIPQYLLARRVDACVRDFLKDCRPIDSISIELQPPKNKRMQRISHYIFMSLYTWSPETPDYQRNYKKASSKLAHFHGPAAVRPTTYVERKKQAISFVKWYTGLMSGTETTCSADDADSFLYALHS